MRALALKDFGIVEVVDVPKPGLEEPGDALVRVTTTAICGSDLHVVHGRIPGMSPGGILGHEFVGVVEAVDGGVRRFAEGDRVVGSFTIPCGECWYCERRLFSRCPDQRVFGYGSFFRRCRRSAGGVRPGSRRRPRAPRRRGDDERRAGALRWGHLHHRVRLRERGADRDGRRVTVVGCGPVV